MSDGWQPYRGEEVRDGMVADLLLPNGRCYRCRWIAYGRITAWWTFEGARRVVPISPYEPIAWRLIPEIVALPVPARFLWPTRSPAASARTKQGWRAREAWKIRVDVGRDT